MKLVFALVFIGIVAARPPAGKIVGGRPTDITEVPWQLSLELNELLFWSHICGASVVGPHAVVTAAHCVVGEKPGAIRFRSGSSSKGEGDIHHASSIQVHPQYDSELSDYDIAFVTVQEEFQFSDSVQPIGISSAEPEDGDTCLISGWGATQEGGIFLPKQLQSVEVPIVDRESCKEQYAGLYEVTERMICAGLAEGGKDSCQGDSGGPLVVNGTLAGIVSWGEGCARPAKSGVYTNAAFFKDWVDQQISKSKLNLQ